MNISPVTAWLGSAVDFLDYLSRATPIVLILGGLLVFYYREKIKAIIARSLSHELEELKTTLAKDLATHTASMQRELESYRVSLIAQAERTKAEQDVRKSIALKAAERRFSAIARLFDAHMGIDTDVIALASIERTTAPAAAAAAVFSQRWNTLHDRVAEYSKATDAAQLFISLDLRQKVVRVRVATITILMTRKTSSDPALPRDHESIRELSGLSVELERELRVILLDFEKA